MSMGMLPLTVKFGSAAGNNLELVRITGMIQTKRGFGKNRHEVVECYGSSGYSEFSVAGVIDLPFKIVEEIIIDHYENKDEPFIDFTDARILEIKNKRLLAP